MCVQVHIKILHIRVWCDIVQVHVVCYDVWFIYELGSSVKFGEFIVGGVSVTR